MLFVIYMHAYPMVSLKTFHYLICLKGSILDYKVLPRGDQKLNGHKGETAHELPEWKSLISHFILHSHQGTTVV